MDDKIRIGASGFSECVTSFPKITHAKLRPFKIKTKGEGAGRSGYYKRALDAIREYHRRGNDPTVFKNAKQELGALFESLDPKTQYRDRVKTAKNVEALIAYEQVYGHRLFLMQNRHRISVQIGHVVITAQPDLWVSENGVEVLIKVGAAKKKEQEIDIMLYLLRKAAVASGYRIRSRNVVYLDIAHGQERCCQNNLARFNRVFAGVAKLIEATWPEVMPAA
jgi:hypothetical protein